MCIHMWLCVKTCLRVLLLNMGVLHWECCMMYGKQSAVKYGNKLDLIWFEQLVITCVYLSSGVFTQDFSSQFSELLSFLQAENAKHLIVGDFNFHVNIDTDVDAKKLLSLLHQFDLIQHVNVPTHTAGNALDLVISKDDLLVRDISTDLSVRSDHFAVLFTLSFPSPGLPKQTVTYRSWKSVDHDVMLLEKPFLTLPAQMWNQLFTITMKCFSTLLTNMHPRKHVWWRYVLMHRGIIPSWLKKRDLNGNMNANITEASLPSIENFTAISGINITTCWIQPNRTTSKIKWNQQLPPKNFSKCVIIYWIGQMKMFYHLITVGLN